MLAGTKSLAVIADWLPTCRRPCSPRTAHRCASWPGRPLRPKPPSAAPCNAIGTAIGSWLADREHGPTPPGQPANQRSHRTLAVDGKTVCGTRRKDSTQVQLLAAMTIGSQALADRENNEDGQVT